MKIYVKPFFHPIFKGTYDVLSKIGNVNKINFNFSSPLVYEKQNIRKYLIYGLMNFVPFPKVMYYPGAKDCDIIYSPQSIVPLNNKKYIVEMENVGMYVRKKNKEGKIIKYFAKKFLFRKNLIKILTYSEAATKSVLYYFRDVEGIEKMVETSYPVIEENYKKYKKTKNEKPVIGFICGRGSRFFVKGGKIVTDVACELVKTHDFKLLLKADVPIYTKKKLDKYGVDYEIIDFIPSRDELYKRFYSRIDILFYPTIKDTFGFVLLEAKSMGIPIVACEFYSSRDIIGDGGIVVDSCFKELMFSNNMLKYDFRIEAVGRFLLSGYEDLKIKLKDALIELLEDASLYNRCRNVNIKEVTEGRYSYKYKEKQLRKILNETKN